jgi:hypothetical protein
MDAGIKTEQENNEHGTSNIQHRKAGQGDTEPPTSQLRAIYWATASHPQATFKPPTGYLRPPRGEGRKKRKAELRQLKPGVARDYTQARRLRHSAEKGSAVDWNSSCALGCSARAGLCSCCPQPERWSTDLAPLAVPICTRAAFRRIGKVVSNSHGPAKPSCGKPRPES